MPRFTQETAVAALELHQLIAEWGNELDLNGGSNIAPLLTEDCNYLLAGKPFRGHEAILKFYADRNERVRTQQKDGIRTQRHAITNLRVSFKDSNNATVHFLIVNFSAEGPAPVFNATNPTIVADVRMECRLEADGEWRISEFDSAPVFVGNDPFLNAGVIKK